MNCARPHKKVMTKDAGMPLCSYLFHGARTQVSVFLRRVVPRCTGRKLPLKVRSTRYIPHSARTLAISVRDSKEEPSKVKWRLNRILGALIADNENFTSAAEWFYLFQFEKKFHSGSTIELLPCLQYFFALFLYLLQNHSRIAQSITSESWRWIS